MNITCDAQSMALNGWSHSPGTKVVTNLLDTSPSKYMVNGNTLTIVNISSSDEGVYSCIYSNDSIPEHCIYVYGKLLSYCDLIDFLKHEKILAYDYYIAR